MSNFARILNNVATDVSDNPAANFHASIINQFVEVPDKVRAGWILLGDEWQPPEVSNEAGPLPTNPKVSPVEFKLLFTSSERIAIATARATDPVVNDFFGIIDDPKLTTVDLGLASTQSGLTYLVNLGLLTAERREEILTGNFQ